MNVKTLTSDKVIFFLISLLLCFYLVIRAILVPIGHDEAATFFFYVQTGSFLPLHVHYDANNHILNSFLTWIFYSLLGPSPFALRLANLLFAPVFFYFSYRLSGLIKIRILRYAFFISLCLCHNFIEFLGLSRGYGMSMALLLASLWFILRYAEKGRILNLVLCLVMTVLAVLANLTLINTMIIISGLLAFLVLSGELSLKVKRISLLIILVAGIGPVIYFASLLFRLRTGGELYSGSSLGFWTSTVKSVIRLLFNANSPAGSIYVICIFAASALLVIPAFFKRQEPPFLRKPGILLFIMFTGNVAATIAIAKILHVNYPEDRLGLYFYPLLIAGFIFLIYENHVLLKKSLTAVLILPLIVIPLHFFLHLNTTYAASSISDNIPARFFGKVESARINGQFPPTIGSQRQGHFAWSYLVYRHGGNLSQEFWSEYPAAITDFIIADPDARNKVSDQYDSIDFNKVSGKFLIKRKYPVEKQLVYSRTGIATPGQVRSEYITLSEGSIDSLVGKSLYLGYDLQISCDDDPLMAWIVTEVHDKDRNVLRYECIAMEWLRNRWSGNSGRFLNGMPVFSLPQNSATYVSYLWNERKTAIRIENGKFFLSTILP